MERLTEHHCEHDAAQRNGQVALLLIQSCEQSGIGLNGVIRRIRQYMRRGDGLWLLGNKCIILLPGTTQEGAQMVVERLSPLLIDIDYEMQILCDSAALALLQRWQSNPALCIIKRENIPEQEELQQLSLPPTPVERSGAELPYLAFLTSYPPHRLLHLLPYELACRYRCVPVGAERKILTIATCQRLAKDVILQFQALTQKDIFQVRCEAGLVDDVLRYWQRTFLAGSSIGEPQS